MVTCKICNKQLKSSQGLSKHIKACHETSVREYYDKYFNTNDNACPICGKETKFLNMSKGYQKYCSCKCAQSDLNNNFKRNNPQKSKSVVEKTNRTKKLLYNKKQKCKICGKELNSMRGLVFHIRIHNVTAKEYYDKYFKKDKEEFCLICGKEKQFINLERGYSNCKHSINTLRARKLKFERDNDCTNISTLINEYGQGWLSIKDKFSLLYSFPYTFIKNSEIHLIEEYCKENHYVNNKSNKEKEIVAYLKSNFNISIEENSRRIIPPLELDVFIPGLNLAVEYNGTYWHSNNLIAKDYHLNKSLMCRNKGVRLVHIYEFEDFDEQLYLLSELIKGNDLYCKKDFNKNNLIIDIPKPELIYNEKYMVYGAGKLF